MGWTFGPAAIPGRLWSAEFHCDGLWRSIWRTAVGQQGILGCWEKSVLTYRPCPCLFNPFKGSEIRFSKCFQRAPGMALKPQELPTHKQQNKHSTTHLLGPFYLYTEQHQMPCQWWIAASIERQQKQEMDKKLRAITLGLMHITTDRGKAKPNTSSRGVVWKPAISFAMYLL